MQILKTAKYKNLFFIYKTEAEEAELQKKRSRHQEKKMEARKAMAKVTPGLEEQFVTGRLYGKLNLHGQKKSLKN